jgi:hypothetical protein
MIPAVKKGADRVQVKRLDGVDLLATRFVGTTLSAPHIIYHALVESHRPFLNFDTNDQHHNDPTTGAHHEQNYDSRIGIRCRRAGFSGFYLCDDGATSSGGMRRRCQGALRRRATGGGPPQGLHQGALEGPVRVLSGGIGQASGRAASGLNPA